MPKRRNILGTICVTDLQKCPTYKGANGKEYIDITLVYFTAAQRKHKDYKMYTAMAEEQHVGQFHPKLKKDK